MKPILVAMFCFQMSYGQIPWQKVNPEQEGFSPAKLDLWRDGLAAQRTTGLLVLRHNRIVYEWYAPGWSAEKPHGSASLAKALVGGMSLLLAWNDKRLDVDDAAANYITGWKQDPRKSRITLRQLATHTSGMDDAEETGKAHNELTGWKGNFWKRTPDPFSIAIAEAPVSAEPGTRFQYSNPGMASLAYAVTASLRGAPQTDIRALLAERIFTPLGVKPEEWSVGYGSPTDLDGLRLYANWGGGAFTARATARVGQLMMQRGRWNGRQLFDAKLAAKAVTYAGLPLPNRENGAYEPGSGLGWWTNFDGVWPTVPRDAFAGAGAGHQILLVVPSLDLVVVRNGDLMKDDRPASGFFGAPERHLFAPLLDAMKSAPPYPPSPVVRSVRFETDIVRAAIDSDNWPLTWGDDDHLYTAYGDGFGFEPHTEPKLSLGLARVEGTGAKFRGVNIRSDSGERIGDGKNGLKASGLLMVDGVLYMWVRNAGNAQLAWSADHGRTWEWGFRFKVSFASPSFLNFGKNNAGARDRYVYIYSQDGPSAYESNDALLLARVPKDRIRDKGAYEFFTKLDAAGQPAWTKEIEERGAVFAFANHCQRADAVYHPLLRRYLLALGYNHAGGWGMYDAPEPWGPFTTVFHTDYWGLGGTHGYRLPSKWISGNSMYLVFSGVRLPDITYDAFCVRRLTLEAR